MDWLRNKLIEECDRCKDGLLYNRNFSFDDFAFNQGKLLAFEFVLNLLEGKE